jgi:RNA polymerase sigma-70 factor (ECF subfamily)
VPAFRLRAVAPARPRRSKAHEALFLAEYERLWTLARRLTHGDRAQAEDLLQDTYVEIVESAPDLASIDNPRAYLATVIRNLHVSRVRRASNQTSRHLSFEEFDSAAVALQAVAPERLLGAKVALARICAHLAHRKDSSRPAAALALRFLHECSPAEIARIARVSAASVHDWLWQARAEARTAAEQGDHAVLATPTGSADETVQALRRVLFDACRTLCPLDEDLARAYERDAPPLDVATLAHLASCPGCLARASLRVGLGAEPRHPDDDPPVGGADAGAAPPSPARVARRGARRAHQARHHRPRELFVSVNGLPVGDVSVTGVCTHGRWLLRADEPVAFIEIHSEQGIRMAMLHVAPALSGLVEQSVPRILSDERRLTVAIDFSTAHPTVSVAYEDPSGGADAIARPALDPVVHIVAVDDDRWAGWHEWWGRALGGRWRAGLSVVLVAALVGAGVWWSRGAGSGWPTRVPPATALIADAIAGEEAAVTAASDGVTLETLRLTVSPDGDATRAVPFRLERWSRGPGRQATRLLDAQAHVVFGAGAERLDDAPAVLRPLAMWWQAGLSARLFRDGVMATRACASAREASTYRIECPAAIATQWVDRIYPTLHARGAERSEASVRRATAWVDAASRRLIRLDLEARHDGQTTRLSVTSEGLMRPRPEDVPAGLFPSSSAGVAAPTRRWSGTGDIPITASLEVRLLDVVDRIAGDAQVAIQREPHGTLVVGGLVADGAQKQALIEAVRQLAVTSAVRTDVRTFGEGEGARRMRSSRRGSTRVESHELPAGPPPFTTFLRTTRPETDATAVVRELSPVVLGAVSDARRHAHALRALLQRYPEQAAPTLDADGRQAWLALVTRRGTAARVAIDRLAGAVRPYLLPLEDQGATSDGRSRDRHGESAGDLATLAHRLDHEVVLLHEHITRLFLASDGDHPPEAEVSHETAAHLSQATAAAVALQHAADRTRAALPR